MNKICKHCGKRIEKRKKCGMEEWKNKNFCSRSCHNEYRRGKPSPSPKTTFKKGQVVRHNNHPKGERNHKWKGGQISLECKVCSKIFKVDPYRKEAKTCSVQCYNVFRKSPEFRIKLSQKQKEMFKNTIGKFRTISKSLDKQIRHSVHYKIWRETIFLRDNFLCQECGIGGELQADHIKQFALIILQNNIKTFEEALNCYELWNLKNGRTLCLSCHKHTKTYGRKISLK